ncbi:MvdC/MvdD family ATP grasp protein [Streptomyces niveus]|uniref:MvdC/MvdD family ATP grasp protein n=1 Tax=Streptomyces niveus TaxID=193462 RepID=UPI0036787F65
MVTTDENTTADRAVLELAALGVPVIRLDLADFPDDLHLGATFDGDRWTGALVTRGRTVRLEEIRAVLWWHPGRPGVPHGDLSEAEIRWIAQETTAGLAGVLAALDCLHVNHPHATQHAQVKATVLATAARAGLRVPPTWIGNHQPSAAAFTAHAPDGAVCKSLVSPEITSGQTHRTFFTRRVDSRGLTGAAGSLSGMTHQFQHAVVKEFEVRLVVVGDELFAARIDAHSRAARADFRADYEALTYSLVAVPDSVRTGVTALMRACGLLYAALDLLVDDEGQWHLIDVNPAGQYDWLQRELPELTISAALARLLAEGDHLRTRPQPH